jgi:hypothetical protein
MAKLDQEKTCHLHHAADMVRALTDGIVKMDQVYACRGHVTAANLVEKVSSNSREEGSFREKLVANRFALVYHRPLHGPFGYGVQTISTK